MPKIRISSNKSYDLLLNLLYDSDLSGTFKFSAGCTCTSATRFMSQI